MTWLRRVLRAGTLGGLAMIPVGLLIRHALGGTVNVYGELVVAWLFGRVVPWAIGVEHLVVSWMFAVPLVWVVRARPVRHRALVGALYGVGLWVVANSLALPWLFGRPTPWALGWSAIWPSLTVHVAYGVVTACCMSASRAHGTSEMYDARPTLCSEGYHG